jgi:hypothetical protein
VEPALKRFPLCYLLLAGLGLNGCAQASSPDAWQAHEKQVIARCLEASQLKESRALGRPLEYPDALGVTAVLLGGQYPQAHMQGRAGQELCLYHKKTGKAFLQQADDLIGR